MFITEYIFLNALILLILFGILLKAGKKVRIVILLFAIYGSLGFWFYGLYDETTCLIGMFLLPSYITSFFMSFLLGSILEKPYLIGPLLLILLQIIIWSTFGILVLVAKEKLNKKV